MPPKKVAIIGAGPSGLVTAKTLLHNFPSGTFSPVIFDSRYEVGGLWSSPQPGNRSWGTKNAPGSLDPSMRTNLSRFTVAFSDLSWESVLETPNVPMFPQARQVCQYLRAYRKRYIPDDVVRLGCRVLKTVRKTKDGHTARWEISWEKERSGQIAEGTPSKENIPEVEEFDLLVVASGYFARPNIPEAPGLHHNSGAGGVFHSSEIQTTHEILQDKKSLLTRGNVAIIGGSISGAEAASTVALHQSSYFSKDKTAHSIGSLQVHHIYTRPFWSLPTYLPHESSDGTVSFLPLDLVMYDLGRRPAGSVEYGLGLIPEEKAAKTNEYFSSLLGANYKSVGQLCDSSASQNSRSRPPWVAIGNDYAEFVRSGKIEPTMGRAVSAHADPDTGLYNINIAIENGETMTLENIAAVVMATGFTPFEALSFLPEEVRSILEYNTDDPFLPLVLDKGGTIRSEVPDIGFVGFYRGPYWGVMEMQARFLGMEWAKRSTEISKSTEQVEGMRILRDPASNPRRSQFPMGDYVGLMEAFARDLEITRTVLSNDESRSGPVVPSRYPYNEISSTQQTDMKEQTTDTLNALEAFLGDISLQAAAAAMAVFRALQGKWTFQCVRQDTGEHGGSGTVKFCPVYPSDSAYDREYICEETLEPYFTEDSSSPSSINRSVFRLSEAMSSGAASQIQIVSEKANGNLDIKSARSLLLGPLQRKKYDGIHAAGEYVIQARVSSANTPDPQPRVQDHADIPYDYTFNFEGVSIVSWERLDRFTQTRTEGELGNHTTPPPRTRTLYRR
ncbi:FAD-dependent pyridine nucleotide-disulfide oxidoreductase [Penicillium angulare]|uniref:FAD-dependent pyridine nucleotide-disulfide oxidoreductase n=1 Tax=Penicillium angulare TaxID=116970 RepID=UPI00254032A5|nr:FAD-dependent pyridine nucleotide-disulfide oxidoreductase [Penicillium angulare]KAJ5291589.1 FAD-dependent pyridine nucleotide-disulfide oxidoreductase [Penicillium angulare]